MSIKTVCLTDAPHLQHKWTQQFCQCRRNIHSVGVRKIYMYYLHPRRISNTCFENRTQHAWSTAARKLWKEITYGNTHLIRCVHDQLSFDGMESLFLISRKHFVSGCQKRIHVRNRSTCQPEGNARLKTYWKTSPCVRFVVRTARDQTLFLVCV